MISFVSELLSPHEALASNEYWEASQPIPEPSAMDLLRSAYTSLLDPSTTAVERVRRLHRKAERGSAVGMPIHEGDMVPELERDHGLIRLVEDSRVYPVSALHAATSVQRQFNASETRTPRMFDLQASAMVGDRLYNGSGVWMLVQTSSGRSMMISRRVLYLTGAPGDSQLRGLPSWRIKQREVGDKNKPLDYPRLAVNTPYVEKTKRGRRIDRRIVEAEVLVPGGKKVRKPSKSRLTAPAKSAVALSVGY